MEFDLEEKKYNIVDVLRKRKQDQQRIEQKVQNKIEKIKKRKSAPARDHVPADEFVKSYKKRQTAYQSFKKRSRNVDKLNLEVPNEQLIIAIRIRGTKDISPEQDKILKQYKLKGLMCAVFLKLDTRTLKRLTKIENYITYGYPSKKVISELIYKKAYAKIDQKRVHLNSNQIIEQNFEKQGIICFDDLINEITSLSENFMTIQKFLWPFKLSTPYKNFENEKSILPFSKGGNWGNREEKINDLILSML